MMSKEKVLAVAIVDNNQHLRTRGFEREEEVIQTENKLRAAYENSAEPAILFCPMCHARHIDGVNVGAHKTHACQDCGFLWQPMLIKTHGVKFLPGCKDEDR